MVSAGIPDEIGVQDVPEIETPRLVLIPLLHPDPVDILQHRILASVEARIVFSDVADSFGDLEANLHSHGPLGKRPHQRLKGPLGSIPHVIVVIVGIESVEFVARDEAAIHLHGHSVQVVPHGQQLAERRLAQRFLVFGHGGRHYLRYSLVSSRSRSRPQ